MSRPWVVVGSGAAVVFAALAFAHVPAQIRVSPFDRYGRAVAHGEVPYHDFSLEYPPGALPPIVLPALVPKVSYVVAFRALEALVGCGLLLCLAYLLRDAGCRQLVLRVGLVALTPLLLGPVVFFRFDLWPTFLTVASLVALERSRLRLSAGLVGAAIAAKLYAGVLLPPLALRTGRTGVGWTLGIAAALTLPLALIAPGGVADSLRRQLVRDVQIESVPGSIAELASLAGLGRLTTNFSSGSSNIGGPGVATLGLLASIVGVGLLALVWVRLWRARRCDWQVPVVYAGTVAIVLVCTKVLSPQYLLWLVPLAVLIRGTAGALAAALLAIAMVLTQLVYPSRYDGLVALERGPILLLATRNLLLVVVAVILVSVMFRELQRDRVAQHEGG